MRRKKSIDKVDVLEFSSPKKPKTISETRIQSVDTNTGEVIQQEYQNTIMTETEPDFIKLYLNTMMTFNGIEGIPIDVVMAMCNYMTYANDDKTQMTISFDKYTKTQLSKSLGCSTDMVSKYIKKSVDTGLLFKTEFRGRYIVNPFIIAKGEWKNIKKLRAEFEFSLNSKSWKLKKDIIVDTSDFDDMLNLGDVVNE